MTSTGKLYVTNRGAAATKYGAEGWRAIDRQLAALTAADTAREITAEVVQLDSPPAGVLPVSDPTNPSATKSTVDALCRSFEPDYLVLVGGDDIVCFQPLDNPVHVPGDLNSDPDADVPSDLPYACDAAHSRAIGDFLAPSRVVGRLPDTPGRADLDSFLAVLEGAAAHTPIAPPYQNALLVSAAKWQPAAHQLVAEAFGGAPTVVTSPTEGPNWTAEELARQWHLFSCHGASAAPEFYGEDAAGTHMPPAHQASHLSGQLAAGTLCVTGCCYGAQLYDPSFAGGAAGISFAYLTQQSGGYVGSTNIAYGQDHEMFGCDEFSSRVLAQLNRGSSTGRALLEARQYLAAAHTPLSPVLLKTLAQFVLYGDPSVHPLRQPHTTPGETAHRQTRRRGLVGRAGDLTAFTTAAVAAEPATTARDGTATGGERLAASLLAEAGLEVTSVRRFVAPDQPTLPQPRARGGLSFAAAAPSEVRAYYVAVGHADEAQRRDGIASLVGVEVTELVDGTLESRQFSSRGQPRRNDGVLFGSSEEGHDRQGVAQ